LNQLLTQPGVGDPLGASIVPGGVNFAVYARQATGLDLLLFDDVEAGADAATSIPLDPNVHRTGDYWHILVPDLQPGQLYGFAAHGPWAPADGQRFDPTRVLLDPYGRGTAVPHGYRRSHADAPASSSVPMKSVVIDPSTYDWEGDRPLATPFQETIVYEAHLAGFTADPGSGVAPELRGTYAGFIEKIPYLVDLGITAVELLPVFQFDVQAAPDGLVNYWGYQTVSFFAPHVQYASRPDAAAAVDEFRDLVKALHRAGLEVILDVVYNHTAEGGDDGPTLSFRGLADDDYYLLDPDDRSHHADFTGTGNTMNANGAVVRRLIRDSLRYWVHEMHVDGFRFDLAAVFSRDESGHPIPEPPILFDIETDPVLAGTRLIAEAWDAGGLYQVGNFAGDRWVEWNGRFRDDVRAFLRGEPGMVAPLVQRFLGSPDIYGHKDPDAESSLNFVTCHDGFTLNDLVSYETKHNEGNGEGNRDGSDINTSWNVGVEGPTDDPAIERLRERQIRNFLVLDLLSIGVPMLLMGDEVRRTQHGNNNAYAQDNLTGWFDWADVERHAGLLRFTRGLIRVRRQFLDLFEGCDPDWHGVRLGEPDTGYDSRSIALTFRSDRLAAHIICNAYWEPLEFELPDPGVGDAAVWRRIIDTNLPPPDDVVLDPAGAPRVEGSYLVTARSVVVLVARGGS
jgi:glycogen debranching enzyme GlgX